MACALTFALQPHPPPRLLRPLLRRLGTSRLARPRLLALRQERLPTIHHLPPVLTPLLHLVPCYFALAQTSHPRPEASRPTCRYHPTPLRSHLHLLRRRHPWKTCELRQQLDSTRDADSVRERNRFHQAIARFGQHLRSHYHGHLSASLRQ